MGSLTLPDAGPIDLAAECTLVLTNDSDFRRVDDLPVVVLKERVEGGLAG